ncbi:MAG: hypothetical protein DRJ64_02370 [Thermoprotei archaeon]|nr:MAG: hypothetical protein DRJ64_02370 [Thermoprotei archaeon]
MHLRKLRKYILETFHGKNNGNYIIDILSGTDKVRMIVEGDTDIGKVIEEWNRHLREYRSKTSRILLYG